MDAALFIPDKPKGLSNVKNYVSFSSNIKIVKDAGRISNFSELKPSFSTSFTAIYSSDELNVLGSPQYAKTSQGKNSDIKGGLYCKNFSTVFQNSKLRIKSIQSQKDGLKKVSHQIIGPESEWIDASKDCSLNETDLGCIDFNEANVVSNWNDPCYGTGDGYYYPLVNYGRWFSGTNVVQIEDFRPWINPMTILSSNSVCQKLGYRFESDFLSNPEYGGKIINYLLDKDFVQNSVKDYREEIVCANLHSDPNDFTSITVGQGEQTLVFEDEIFDGQSLYDNSNGCISGDFSGRICFNMDIALIPEPGASSNDLLWQIKIVCEDIATGVTTNLVEEFYINNFGIGTTTDSITYETDEMRFSSDKKYYVTFRAINTAFYILLPSTSLKVKRPDCNYVDGDEIDLGKALSSELTLYDLIKGLSEVFNLRFYTDEVNRIIKVEPYNEYTLWDSEKYEGFVKAKDQAFDLSSKLDLRKGIKYTCLNLDNSEIQFNFKDGKDALVSAKDESSSPDTYGNNFTLNDIGKAKQQTNSLFAATCNIYDNGLSNESEHPCIPALWKDVDDFRLQSDNSYSSNQYPQELSKEICPRILFAGGLLTESNNNGVIPSWNFEGSQMQAYPKAWQLNKENLSAPNVVYGDSSVNKNVVNTFFQKQISIQKNGIKIELKAILTKTEMQCLDLRCPVYISPESLPDTDKQAAGFYLIDKVKYNPFDACDPVCFDLIPLDVPEICCLKYKFAINQQPDVGGARCVLISMESGFIQSGGSLMGGYGEDLEVIADGDTVCEDLTVNFNELSSLDFSPISIPRVSKTDGNCMVVATDNSLEFFDVSNPAAPVFISSIPLGGGQKDIIIDGGFVYVIKASSPDMVIFDVSDKSNIQQVGTANIFTTSFKDFCKIGNLIYAVGSAGLFIIDVSNPAAPVLTSTGINLPSAEVVIECDGNMLYIASERQGTSQAEIATVDVSNPTAPVLLDTEPLLNLPNAFTEPSGLCIRNGIAYITAGNRVLKFDVSTPSNIASNGFESTGISLGEPICNQDCMIASSFPDNLNIFSFDDDNDVLSQVGSFGLANSGVVSCFSVIGNRVYIVSGNQVDGSTLQIVDFEKPNELITLKIECDSGFFKTLTIEFDEGAQGSGNFILSCYNQQGVFVESWTYRNNEIIEGDVDSQFIECC